MNTHRLHKETEGYISVLEGALRLRDTAFEAFEADTSLHPVGKKGEELEEAIYHLWEKSDLSLALENLVDLISEKVGISVRKGLEGLLSDIEESKEGRVC